MTQSQNRKGHNTILATNKLEIYHFLIKRKDVPSYYKNVYYCDSFK